MLVLTFPGLQLKLVFMDFPDPSLVEFFLSQPGYMSPDMCVLRALNLLVGSFETRLFFHLITEK